MKLKTQIQLRMTNSKNIQPTAHKIINSKIQKMLSWTDSYRRIYTVRKYSFEHMFCILTYFLMFAVPFYFCFGGKNFWFDEQFAEFQIDYYYTGYYGVEVSYLTGTDAAKKEILVLPGSAVSNLTELALAVDQSGDKSEFLFTLTNFQSQILSTNLILFYDVSIPALDRVVSTGMAFTIPSNFVDAQVSGFLQLQVSTPFNALTGISAPTINPPSYLDQSLRTPTSLRSLIQSHLESPYKLSSPSTIEYLSEESPGSRSLKISLRKDKQVVLGYYPQILETFKLKFSNYFGMLLLSYLIFRGGMLLFLKAEVLEAHLRDQAVGGNCREVGLREF